jgi:hypothetical protein
MGILGIISIFGIFLLGFFIMFEEIDFIKIKQWIKPTVKSKNESVLDSLIKNYLDGKISAPKLFEESKQHMKKIELEEVKKMRKQKLNKIFKNK